MLNNKEPRATVGVKDLEAARLFYEGKLGLVPTAGRQEPTTITYKCGSFFLSSTNRPMRARAVPQR
jgi:catechol 2,3-dioxygenase-like lactoylglutathione lyase family enzyme